MVYWADRGENEVIGQHQVVDVGIYQVYTRQDVGISYILGYGYKKFMGRQNGVFIMPVFTLQANLGISRFPFLIFCFALLFSYQLFPAAYPHQSQITVLKLILVLSSFFPFLKFFSDLKEGSLLPFFLYCNHYAFEGLFVLINRMTFLPKLSHFPIPEKNLIQGNFALERKILLSYPICLLKKGKKGL